MDFVTALTARGVDFHPNTAKKNEIMVCCPFCPDRGQSVDTRFRLGINIATGWAHCFNCDWRSRDGLVEIGVKLILAGVEVAELEEEVEEPEPVTMPEDFWPLWKPDDDPLFRRVYKYIRGRGITQDELKSHRIGFTLAGRMAYRVLFPLRYRGQLLMLIGRDFTGKLKPKYLNSVGPKAVYNLPDQPTRTMILSEGVVKCLKLQRALKIQSASLLGHSMSPYQHDFMKKVKQFYLWPDPDTVGIAGFVNVAEVLAQNHKVWMPWPVPKKQADEYSDERLDHLFATTMKPFNEHLSQLYRLEAGKR